MKTPLLLALVIATPVLAHDPHGDVGDDRVFHRASELVAWCKEETQAYFVGQGITTYQWRASYHDRGDQLIVDGKLRTEEKDVAVQCRVARGARERYATVDIQD